MEEENRIEKKRKIEKIKKMERKERKRRRTGCSFSIFRRSADQGVGIVHTPTSRDRHPLG